jgi:predicted peroxiredoxin
MNRTSHNVAGSIMLIVLVLAATSYMVFGQDRGRSPSATQQTIIIHLSSGPDDVFASTLALRMAEDALDQRKKVILFLDKRGVRLAQHDRTDQLRLSDEDPLWFILDTLARRSGFDVIVCGESACIQGLFPRDFMHYVFIADSPGTILQHIDRNTVVFTY